MIKRILYLSIVLCLLCVSCKKNEKEVDFHLAYYPMENGRFVEYEVTEIYHDENSGIHDTSNYRLKTVIGDTIIDNSGRVARKIYRYIFNTQTNEYVVKDLWTGLIDQYRFELVEENQRLIKLVFSPTLNKEWDMNAFNSFDPIYAYYENLHKAVSFGQLDFDSTITVVEEIMEPNLIEYRRKTEVYAKNVGLVSKYYKDLTISDFDTLQVKRGTELYYTVIGFGVE
jgi:hypothetical protein